MAETDRVIIGIGGHAVALDAGTGTELWRTKLKSSSVVTVAMAGKRVLAGTGGEVFCLDAYTGRILWRNKLKGLGLGIVTLPGTDAAAAAGMQEAQRQSAGAGA
jgi:outer membrane protein assembly factor BamB